MPAELQTYLIGLIPSLAGIFTLIPIVIKVFTWIKSIVKRDDQNSTEVKKLTKKIDELIEADAALRKENLALRRQNQKLMSKITNIYIEDKEE